MPRKKGRESMAIKQYSLKADRKKKLSPNFTVYEGSPPRVRGKARGAGVGYMVCGITPACAGKS